MSSKKSSRNHPPLFSVHLNELPQNESGVPLVLEAMCRHLLKPDVVDCEDLFSTGANTAELRAVRKLLEESRGSNVDLSQYPATTTAALLVEFFSQLPVPLSAHLSGSFLKALAHQKPALQIAELKALVRQLPDVHRNVLNYILRFFVEVSSHEHDNGATRQILADAFATKIFRLYQDDQDDEDDDYEEEDGAPEDKEKLFLLMLTHQADLEGMSVRSRAVRAGVIPEGTLTVGSSPASTLSSVQKAGSSTMTLSTSANSPDKAGKSPQSSGSVVHSGAQGGGSHAIAEAVDQLPMILDEGCAAVRQLTDSNEALSALLQHLQSQIGPDGFSPDKRGGGDMSDVRERLDKCEEAQAASQEALDAVQEKLSGLPSATEFKATATKVDGLNKSNENWQKAVLGRLEDVEERLDQVADEDEDGSSRKGGGVSAEEVARMVKTAVEDALLRRDRVWEEEFKTWRAQTEKEMGEWKRRIEEETKTEAAVAAAGAMKTTIEEAKGATKEVREALAGLGEAQKAGGGGVGGSTGVGREEVEALQKEVQGATARLDNQEARLDDYLKTMDETDEKMVQVVQDAEVLLERVNVLDKTCGKVSKWQDSFVNEPPDLRDVRGKIDCLSKAVEELKAKVPAASSTAVGGGAQGGAGVEKEVMEVKVAQEGLVERVVKCEEQIQKVEEMVTEAANHVETLRDVSMQAVESMRKMQALNLERSSATGSGASSEEMIGTILEHLNPEITVLREAVHSVQQQVGEPVAKESAGEEDEDTSGHYGEEGGPVFVQLSKLWAALGESPSAARFDALTAQADMTQEHVAEINQQLATLRKGAAGSSPGRSSADAPADVEEMLARVEKVEEDVAALIGARDARRNAVGDAEERMKTEIKSLDERVGELFEKVEGLVAGMSDSVAAREALEALQIEQESLKKNAQQFKARTDEAKQRADDAHDKVQKLEQKFIKEMEDKDDELEAIQKALAGAGTLTSASEQLARVRDGLAPSPAMPASPAPSDMTAKLCARLTDQVKRLEEAMDTTAGEQQSLTERVRESASAIRRLQASVEQLDVHRGAVYVSDIALQKVQDEVRRLARSIEGLQLSAGEALEGSRVGLGGVSSSSDGDSVTRLREQLNLLRSEVDAGFIKYNNSLDATARTGARAEALGKSLEALVKQTREEMTMEVEQERLRVTEAESKVRKVGDRLKKQLDEALEEMRTSIEGLEGLVADSGSKGHRKLEAAVQPLLERTCVIEEEIQRMGEVLADTAGSSSNKAEAEATVTLVALRELEGKVARVESVQVTDGKRLSTCEQEMQAAKADLQRCISAVAGIVSGGDGRVDGTATSTPGRPLSRAGRGKDRSGVGAAWDASTGVQEERKRWPKTRESSSDESADEAAAALLRESRFRSRTKASQQQGAVRGEREGNGQRRSASPTMRRPAATSDSMESEGMDARDHQHMRRPSSAMRERPRPSSAQRQPMRATYGGGRGMEAPHAQMYKSGAARGLDRAVERELTQLKRMFGL